VCEGEQLRVVEAEPLRLPLLADLWRLVETNVARTATPVPADAALS
jgi:hypothetical protein